MGLIGYITDPNFRINNTLDSITILHLKDVYLSIFPKVIFRLSNLESISLENNRISYIPVELTHLTCLVELDLTSNPLTPFSDSLMKYFSKSLSQLCLLKITE